jgi:taurine dioxygenase
VEITPLTPVFGARIEGVDASLELDERTKTALRDALYHYGVLHLPDQELSPERLAAFGRNYGTLRIPGANSLAELREVSVISNIKRDGKYIGDYDGGRYWHTDGSYIPKPHRASFLHAIQVPLKDGTALGDTLFASTVEAYRRLPDDLRERLRGMHVVNSMANRYGTKATADGRAVNEQRLATAPPAAKHPIARPHPVTGELCLYVNEGYSESIAELPPEEAQPILKLLFEYMTQPEFVYRHRWTEGDLVVWDNCLTIHRATFDYPPETPRLLHRVVVAG